MTTQPLLHGISVLDLSTVGPASRASRILSDYGADVVKVGSVRSAGSSQTPPPFYAYSGHRRMRRAAFNLKSETGRDAFLALAAGTDVVIESFRPGVVDRLGIGYDTVRLSNPDVIYCSTTGFGQTGPRSQWAGHDLDYLALSGYLHCSGRTPDGTPALPGATIADIAAGGMQAAMSIMAALLGRANGGEGCRLDVSISDGAFAMMSLYVDEYLATGTEPQPGHYILTGRYACYGLYTCGDGRHLAVAAIEPRFWENFCRALGLEDLTDAQMDDARQDELRTAISRVLDTRGRDEWASLLGPDDCCVAPVLSVAEAVEDPGLRARGLVVDATGESTGPFRQMGPAWAGTLPPDQPVEIRDPAATDTRELLAEVGFSSSRIDRLGAEKAIA